MKFIYNYMYNYIQFILWLTLLITQNYKLMIIIQWLLLGDLYLSYMNKISTKPIIVFIQVLSRVGVACFTIDGYLTKYLIITWSLADTTRYLYYIYPKSRICTYLRYNLFWILYPIGMLLEVLSLIYQPRFIIFPEVVNIIYIMAYLLLGPIMYNHMVIACHKINLSEYFESLEHKDGLTIKFYRIYKLNIIDRDEFKNNIYKIIPKSNIRIIETLDYIQIKDYGLQVSWRNVFIIEYIGPIIIGLLNYTDDNKLLIILLSIHYIKRLFETIYIHIFSSETMPIANLFRNSAYYWMASYIITKYCDYKTPNYIFIIIWIYSQIMNYLCHKYLRDLRSKTKLYVYPEWYPFRYVVAPNYSFEILGWISFTLIFKSYYSLIFTIIGFIQMYIWGLKKKKRYSELFDNYKVKYILIPKIL